VQDRDDVDGSVSNTMDDMYGSPGTTNSLVPITTPGLPDRGRIFSRAIEC